MKLNAKLGFIREHPDPVVFPENKYNVVSSLIYKINTMQYDYGLNSSTIYINSLNEVYINNTNFTKFESTQYGFFIQRLLDIKSEQDIDDLFLSFGKGWLEYIDILDGPYMRTYNNYEYFIRYYAFAFGTEKIQHYDVIETILEYIEKSQSILSKEHNPNVFDKLIKLGMRLIKLFNPFQSMKLIQLYYFYGLEDIANIILKVFMKKLGKESKRFYDANNINYLQKAVQLMVDLERVRINVADVYLYDNISLEDRILELRIHMNKIKKEIKLLEVD